MLRPLEKSLIQASSSIVFLLASFEIDIGFPEHFGHIQHVLIDSELVNRSRAFFIAK